MKYKPYFKTKDLRGAERKQLVNLVREYVNHLPSMKKTMGIEAAEEFMFDLLDHGLAKITWDRRVNCFGLELYDPTTDKYIPVRREI